MDRARTDDLPERFKRVDLENLARSPSDGASIANFESVAHCCNRHVAHGTLPPEMQGACWYLQSFLRGKHTLTSKMPLQVDQNFLSLHMLFVLPS